MPTKKKDFFKKMGTSLKEKAESFVDTMDEKMEMMGDNFEFGTFPLPCPIITHSQHTRWCNGLPSLLHYSFVSWEPVRFHSLKILIVYMFFYLLLLK